MPAFFHEITVTWGDCDAMGIVFYPNYFRWIDASFHSLARHLGFSQRSLPEDYGIAGTPLADVGCNFVSPATYGDTLTVRVTTSEIGRASLLMAYEFRCGDRVVARGHEKRVFVKDSDGTLRSAPVPEDLRARFEAVQDD